MGLEPNRRVFAVQTRTTGGLPGPIPNTTGEDSTEDTIQESPEIDLTELYMGERVAPGNDEIIIEVEVDNVEEEGNEEEETVSNDDMEYNVTVECWEIIVAQKAGWKKHQFGLEMPGVMLLCS